MTVTMATAPGAGRDDRPKVSVVIPVRDEAASIAACLQAIQAQDYPADRLEILVVDGGSRDGSQAIVEAFRRQDARIRQLDNPAGSIPAGLNVGIRAATGEIIARVDARTRLATGYLVRAVRLLAGTGAANVGGPVRYAPRGFRARLLALVTESRFGVGGAAVRYGDGAERWTETVYLGVVPRRVFEAVGLYDEEILQDEDSEFNCRVRAHGGRVLVSPALRSSYTNVGSLRRFVRKNFEFGYWKVRVWQKYPLLIAPRHLAPPLFVLGLAFGVPAAALAPALRPVLVTALGVYAVGAVAAAAHLGRRAGWRYAPALPALFAVLHLAWGTGFLAGLLRFLPRWFARPLPPPALDAQRISVTSA